MNTTRSLLIKLGELATQYFSLSEMEVHLAHIDVKTHTFQKRFSYPESEEKHELRNDIKFLSYSTGIIPLIMLIFLGVFKARYSCTGTMMPSKGICPCEDTEKPLKF